ncbi:MAG: oxidoreductase, partial [Rhodobacterales bacterium 17-64-5]
MTPTLRLHDGHRIPKLGFGLWQLPPDQTGGLVNAALESGYRMLDGASIYGNEAGLGQGIRASGLPREEVFVTTKVWNEFQGFDSTLRAVEESLARIGVNYLDLCLIHWPAPRRNRY